MKKSNREEVVYLLTYSTKCHYARTCFNHRSHWLGISF